MIELFQLGAKKSLGQNFLLDLNLTAKIARAAGNVASKNIIEIGPGPGGLTRALLDTDCTAVYAIERDDRCIAALQAVVDAAKGKLQITAADALKVDLTTLCAAPRAIVANLPYNIATPLLISWLAQYTAYDSMTLMFQKEVAMRMVAKPRSKEYGRLSVIVQWLCQVEKKFDLPAAAFTPPPKVTSTVVHLTPRAKKDDVTFATMEKITAAAFGQRRKMLRQSLKTLDIDVDTLLAVANLPPTARAEEIDIAGFVRLAAAFQKL